MWRVNGVNGVRGIKGGSDGRLVHFANRTDEAITSPGDGLNAAVAGTVFVKDPPQRRHLHREIVLLHDNPRPHTGQDGVLGDQGPRLIEQQRKDFGRA